MNKLVQHFKKVVDVNNKKTLLQYFTSMEFFKGLVDGNVAHNMLIRGPAAAGRQVGTDYNGNKYFEDNTTAYGRKRWVVYADKFDYNPTSVPAEWHGWLNYINDYAPTEYQFKKPIYAVEAYQSKTGKHGAYAPKGAWANPEKRSWKKFEAWQPPQSS